MHIRNRNDKENDKKRQTLFRPYHSDVGVYMGGQGFRWDFEAPPPPLDKKFHTPPLNGG